MNRLSGSSGPIHAGAVSVPYGTATILNRSETVLFRTENDLISNEMVPTY